mmetsp:Transcript_43645/g.72501  ORF Transcript_43645/g.72501 Transcript_43645/m.72501 type:complete len:159 (-) Transcript_43645:871-1347(-)
MASSNAQLTASSTSTFESLQQHQQQPRPLCRSLSNMQSTVSAPRAGGGLVMATKGRAAMTSKMTPKEVIRAGLHLEKEASIVKPELSRSQSANGREAATAANNPRRLNRYKQSALMHGRPTQNTPKDTHTHTRFHQTSETPELPSEKGQSAEEKAVEA